MHHQTAGAAGASSAPSVARDMPGMVHAASAMATPMAGHLPSSPGATTTDLPTNAATQGHHGGPACSDVSVRHCSTASVDAVKLALPPGSFAPRAADSHAAVSALVVAGTPTRAPPDLSLLSRLLI
ncbi:hypothetical protein [Streptomyces mayteni]